MQTIRRCALVAALAAVVTLTGCGEDTPTPPPADPDISEFEAVTAGAVIASEVVDAVVTFRLDTLQLAVVEPIRKLGWTLPATAGECGTFSNFDDSDGDGVFDDATITLDSTSCVEQIDTLIVKLSGSIRIVDPGTTPGYDLTYSNLLYRYTSVRTHALLRRFQVNGTKTLRVQPTSATVTKNITRALEIRFEQLLYSRSNTDNWTVTFTSDEQLIDPLFGLPDGTLAITGSTRYTQLGRVITFTLANPTALVYDGECDTWPRITGGEVRARVEGSRRDSYLNIQYRGCGREPVTLLVP